jgi:hypothetical protein
MIIAQFDTFLSEMKYSAYKLNNYPLKKVLVSQVIIFLSFFQLF